MDRCTPSIAVDLRLGGGGGARLGAAERGLLGLPGACGAELAVGVVAPIVTVTGPAMDPRGGGGLGGALSAPMPKGVDTLP